MTEPSNPVRDGVNQRRAALHETLLGRPGAKVLSGLALSGGGIRSATFCFGVVKALAANGQLLRFDMLSTVSGGGFIGATVGRLFDLARQDERLSAYTVQQAVGDADRRWFGWWLRAHGRYLTPRGANDMLYMASLMLRNLLGVHLELALLAMLVGCVLSLVNLGGWSLVQAFADVGVNREMLRAWPWFPGWLPTLVALIPIPIGLMAVTMTAYWAVPTGVPQPMRVLLKRGALWLSALAVLMLCRQPLVGYLPGGAVAWWALWGWSLIWVLGIVLTLAIIGPMGKDETRARLTQWQANLFTAVLLLIVVGVIDRAAWWLAFEVRTSWVPGAVLVTVAATLRTVLSKLGDSSGSLPAGGARVGLAVANALGWLLTLALLSWWVSLLYKVVFPPAFGHEVLKLDEALCSLVPVALCAVLYALASGTNASFLNQSSLHHFYRGRLVRSYLGAANGKRFVCPANDQTLPTDLKPGEAFGQYQVAQIDDSHAQDDCAMFDYAPQAKGGPVHLIGVCLNRTQRGQGGEFSQDRKALSLTVAPGGHVSVAARPWQRASFYSSLSLGQWVSISGAAMAPGLGAMTRSGLSALATFAGARLGYWWTADEVAGLPPARWGRQLFAKSRRLLDELRGHFRGDLCPDWFLTDGGHFENTAVYALLRERTELIVLADCGADPNYRFCDLENLVRKARIDHGARIEFMRPKPGIGDQWRLFGSLGDLASTTSEACVALARVHYRAEGDLPALSGVLILLKPNVFKGLPVDLMNFKVDNPEFPQQGTSDQFFNEAQWESHFRLGEEIGNRLSEEVFTLVLGDLHDYFEADAGQASVLRHPGDAQPEVPEADNWRRRVAGNTVRASISLGAAAAVGTTAWQAWDQFNRTLNDNERVQDQALQSLTERWGRLVPLPAAGASEPGTVAARVNASALAAELLRVAQRVCPTDVEGGERWLDQQDVVKKILEDALEACAAPSPQGISPACRQLTAAALDSRSCLSVGIRGDARTQPACPVHYWGRDYTNADDTGCPPPRPELALDHSAAAVPAATTPPFDVAKGPLVVDAGEPATPASEAAPVAQGSGADIETSSAVDPDDVPRAVPAPPPGRVCDGRKLYVQIYGAQQRDLLRTYREDWRHWGLSVPPIEDVVASAKRDKRRSPTPVATTEVRYFSDADKACAERILQATKADGEGALDLTTWNVRSIRGIGQAGVLELWVAPPQE